MRDYLKSWRFTPQKPKNKADKQNSKAVNKWIEEEYPKIKRQAKIENAEIHQGDELQITREFQKEKIKEDEQTGIRNTSQYGRSYAPKGKTPVKKIMAKKLSIKYDYNKLPIKEKLGL